MGSLQLLLSVIGIVRRADLEREDPWWEGTKGGAGGGSGGGGLAANMIICRLANFRRLDGPIPSVSIGGAARSREERGSRKMNQV